MSPYLQRAAKAAVVTICATLAGWKLFEGLYVWADHAAAAEEAADHNAWFAGSTQHVAAYIVGVLFVPLATWTGLHLTRIRGNHLTILASGLAWIILSAPHLVDCNPDIITVVAWTALQTALTAAAAAATSPPRVKASR
ncbi:hypothetical protein [Streptomyces longhuiensis]|uniref:hypothetical protein n=1 Tax=Streptomyces longhuiensis TaxID=2880933 RepID=UPI001D0BD1C0|nr:hypothetical protein [Streptomyces longhuiensis]UDM05457.1 hypothetical protein LGI35_45200 [Streptomyces longhuiensis]